MRPAEMTSSAQPTKLVNWLVRPYAKSNMSTAHEIPSCILPVLAVAGQDRSRMASGRRPVSSDLARTRRTRDNSLCDLRAPVAVSACHGPPAPPGPCHWHWHRRTGDRCPLQSGRRIQDVLCNLRAPAAACPVPPWLLACLPLAPGLCRAARQIAAYFVRAKRATGRVGRSSKTANASPGRWSSRPGLVCVLWLRRRVCQRDSHMEQQKVTVNGDVEEKKVLRQCGAHQHQADPHPGGAGHRAVALLALLTQDWQL
jgi:hypothetical protein